MCCAWVWQHRNILRLWSECAVSLTSDADFIANLVLNTGVNANWRLTGQGDMFNAESSAVATGMQEVWAVYQRLGDKERALLLEVARVFEGER
ncbi:MAG: hypothetical protein DYG89_25830 [Caldilinea sp. CFX5]|nr:hypothetical protein [Caldilinea sp. CFX5]